MLAGAAEPEEARFLPTALVFSGKEETRQQRMRMGRQCGGRGGGTCQPLGARQQCGSLNQQCGIVAVLGQLATVLKELSVPWFLLFIRYGGTDSWV